MKKVPYDRKANRLVESSSEDEDERRKKAKQDFKLEDLGQQVWKQTAELSKLSEQEREEIKSKAESDVNAFIKKIEKDHQPKIDFINTQTREFYRKKIREIPVLPPTEEELQ